MLTHIDNHTDETYFKGILVCHHRCLYDLWFKN
jgi:hypothetical protein